MSSRRGRFRTKLCRNFALGHCPQGEDCNYIHATPASIQGDLNMPAMLGSGDNVGIDNQTHLATASPVWSTLSPVTINSDQPNYQWGSSPVSAGVRASRIKYRPLSWRTALCRHYVRNRGWCPMGDQCNYIHDLTLAEYARDDVRFSRRQGVSSGGAKTDGKGKMGSKHSHCWAYVQGLCHVQDCQYLHPVAVHLFAPHTPCLAWPNCRRGPLCPYKHPEPYVSDSPPGSPAMSPTSTRPAVESRDLVPRGAVPYNGTMYFPYRSPQPPPAMPAFNLPTLNLPPPPGQQQMFLSNPWEAVWRIPYPQTPMAYIPPMLSPTAWPDNAPRWPDNLAPYPPQGFPKLPVPAFDEPNMNSASAMPGSQSGNYGYEYSVEDAETAHGHPSLSIPESEMPYVPPKHQQVGHARRVSVTIKRKEDLDALALDSSSRGRQQWQTHGDRHERRSWAPSSSSLPATGAATPAAVLYGM
ncbi:hypothetical protein BN946_scf184870.g4 [Trametes cinnabarina]|uniref:C3H1-type domain-containing protein n=1 Tax=Pycnoporus cinnabarinus TaxID=5643 RepID=A0A060S1Q9_PYCCI|nr:hypothetical protein BN946_scf184870.g4 [Trametes cinnabarina]